MLLVHYNKGVERPQNWPDFPAGGRREERGEKEQAMAKQDETAGTNGQADVRTVFGTVEEARAAKPEKHPKWKVWRVVGPNGGARFVWSDGIGHALRQVAQADRYAATCLDRKPVNKQAVAGMLAALSPEERAALLAQYAPPPNPNPTPAVAAARKGAK